MYYLGRYFCNRKRSRGYTISFTRMTIPLVLFLLGITGEIVSFYSEVTVFYLEILSEELIAFYKMNPEPNNRDYAFLPLENRSRKSERKGKNDTKNHRNYFVYYGNYSCFVLKENGGYLTNYCYLYYFVRTTDAAVSNRKQPLIV